MKDSLSEEELREQLSLFYSAPVANDRPDFRQFLAELAARQARTEDILASEEIVPLPTRHLMT